MKNNEKIRLIIEHLLKFFPWLREYVEKNPHIAEEFAASLPGAKRRLVHSWDDLSPDQKKIVLEDFYPQVDRLYSFLKPKWKLYRKGKDPAGQLQKAAQNYLNDHQATFPSITLEYLDDVDLFDWNKSKRDRRFYGKLLQQMVKELTGYKIDAAKLYDNIKYDMIGNMS